MKRGQQLGGVKDGLDQITVTSRSDRAHTFGHNDPFFHFAKRNLEPANSGAQLLQLWQRPEMAGRESCSGLTVLSG